MAYAMSQKPLVVANAWAMHKDLSVDRPDIISFGFREVIDIESRKVAAKTVLPGYKKKGEYGRLSKKFAMLADCPYTVIHTESLVGSFTCIFAKNTEKVGLKDIAVASIKRGMGGRYGNKGGIVSRFVIDDTMLEEKDVLSAARVFEGPITNVDESMVLDHETGLPVIAAMHSGDWEALLAHDRLAKEMRFTRDFRFRSFSEGALTFAPTYRYRGGSDEFDTSEKRRVPAWCDHVLWRSRVPERFMQTHYCRREPSISDHRPISAGFVITGGRKLPIGHIRR
ncbi:DNase I-like protein [Coniophora puteana RWD-64-598 SS2]|uniref:DNase I-like protein n=1 Tax=Coniophora puteana (strain RWD-64-598) TaxID=741705 RepID=A0A5M3MDM6_CONPW|nr:DNase I-like protein [Coniophora puteana RWD-64-598 SS2]EIW76980.1 DNase I-like protein [Coniophora puteana RWD-64-598 SS2]